MEMFKVFLMTYFMFFLLHTFIYFRGIRKHIPFDEWFNLCAVTMVSYFVMNGSLAFTDYFPEHPYGWMALGSVMPYSIFVILSTSAVSSENYIDYDQFAISIVAYLITIYMILGAVFNL